VIAPRSDHARLQKRERSSYGEAGTTVTSSLIKIPRYAKQIYLFFDSFFFLFPFLFCPAKGITMTGQLAFRLRKLSRRATPAAQGASLPGRALLCCAGLPAQDAGLDRVQSISTCGRRGSRHIPHNGRCSLDAVAGFVLAARTADVAAAA